MIAAAIYGTQWGKNKKGKENKTLYGLSRRWAGQGQPRRAPGSAVARDCCFEFAASGGSHGKRMIAHRARAQSQVLATDFYSMWG